MTRAYHERRCKNLDSLMRDVPFLNSLSSKKDKWVFRGQKDSTWCLKTTLERVCTIRGRTRRQAQDREQHDTGVSATSSPLHG